MSMVEDHDSQAPHDPAARLHWALAENPSTAELGVTVTVRGDDVLLTGTVASAERKAEIDLVVHETEPGLRVTNDVQIVSAAEPPGAEDIT
ncbi:MAG: BON domain-containing protein [Actinophytocola sp.]|nr:BON domain-containing protein [Actinophytocola sp.]